jgi:hypothetical protein
MGTFFFVPYYRAGYNLVMISIPSNFRPDIRPIGSSGTVLRSFPTGNPYGLSWGHLHQSEILADFSISSFTINPSALLMGKVIAPIFTISYNTGVTSAAVLAEGSGRNDIASPFTSHLWTTGVFQATVVNSGQLFTLIATGIFNSHSVTGYLMYRQKQFWGLNDGFQLPDEFLISGLTNSQLNASHSVEFTINPTGFYYIYYAFRQAAGIPTFKDKATNIKGGFFLMGSGISFPNGAGFTENYDIYRSDQSGLNTVTIIVENP